MRTPAVQQSVRAEEEADTTFGERNVSEGTAPNLPNAVLDLGPRPVDITPQRLDLRPRRDLFDRRRWRERGRGAVRTLALVAGDTSATLTALLVASLRFSSPSPEAVPLAVIPLAVLLVLLFQAAGGTYRAGPARRRYERIVFCAMGATGAVLWFGHEYGLLALSFLQGVAFAVLLGGSACGVRLLADVVVKRLRRMGWGTTPTLIIGDPHRASEITAHVGEKPASHIRVIGWLTPSESREGEAGGSRNGRPISAPGHGHASAEASENGSSPTGLSPRPPRPGGNGAHGRSSDQAAPRPLGSLGDLSGALEKHDVRSVIVSAKLNAPDLERILGTCLLHGCSVGVVPRALNELPCRVTARDFLGWPLLELQVPRLHLLQTLAKRAMDVLLGAAALVSLAPLLAAIAVAVRLDSPGPVLFRQRRLGVGGRRFTIYKFRTMREDAERLLEEDSELFELYRESDFKLPSEKDPRVTRLGAFLRRTSLDELPQLLNVLAGHMSLVGPRPIVPDEIREYGEQALDFLSVKPGITGDWQVNGRSDVGYPDRAHREVEYIRTWSLSRDLAILLRTAGAVLRRQGAY